MNTKYNAYYEQQMHEAEIRCGHQLVLYDENIDKLLIFRELSDIEHNTD